MIAAETRRGLPGSATWKLAPEQRASYGSTALQCLLPAAWLRLGSWKGGPGELRELHPRSEGLNAHDRSQTSLHGREVSDNELVLLTGLTCEPDGFGHF